MAPLPVSVIRGAQTAGLGIDPKGGAVGERPAALVFNWGAPWEVATAYDGGLCRSRMDLRRALPSRG